MGGRGRCGWGCEKGERGRGGRGDWVTEKGGCYGDEFKGVSRLGSGGLL